MKQTAVEWLQKQLKDVKYNALEKNGYSIAEERLFNQAKEMEKEQILRAHSNGWSNGIQKNFITTQEYYNENFKSE
jgi:hypothetical protein